jgi:diguanylate cyclase (GGDEF)-like protein
MGDEVLKKSAILLNAQLRAFDYAYRIGGEEFAIQLSDVNTSDAEALAERVRLSIEVSCFELDDASVRATISLGIAQFRQSDNTFDDALRRADEALYESKARSRNTITIIE